MSYLYQRPKDICQTECITSERCCNAGQKQQMDALTSINKIEYEIVLRDSFFVIRNCPKCGRKTDFQNTKKFRVNANGSRLDIWLIYQCEECRQTLNLAIYERQKVSSIPGEEYRRFLENDEKLAEMYGKSIPLFRKNKAEIDFDRVHYDFVRRQESTEKGTDRCIDKSLEKGLEKGLGKKSDNDSGKSLIIIHNPYGLNIRPEKQIAAVSGLSRSQVKSRLERGEIEIRVIGGDTYVYKNGKADYPGFGCGGRNHFLGDGG